MSDADVRWDGLEELKVSLRELPKQFTVEAKHVAEGAANRAVALIKEVYGAHVLTGNLRDRIGWEWVDDSDSRAYIRVKSRSPLAWLFDNGSQTRRYITSTGYHNTGRMWGHTPPTHIFVRTMIRERARMYGNLKAMLERAGLRVSGDA